MAHRDPRERLIVYLSVEEMKQLRLLARGSLRSDSSEGRAAIQAWLKAQREESA